jgi:hypothetical protein
MILLEGTTFTKLTCTIAVQTPAVVVIGLYLEVLFFCTAMSHLF